MSRWNPLTPEQAAEHRAENSRRWRAKNPGVAQVRSAAHYSKNWIALNSTRRWSTIFKKYGLDRATYLRRLRQQNFSCAICGCFLQTGHKTHVDHDHVTGKNRALLCNDCNNLIGRAQDDTDTLDRAKEYLIRAGC